MLEYEYNLPSAAVGFPASNSTLDLKYPPKHYTCTAHPLAFLLSFLQQSYVIAIYIVFDILSNPYVTQARLEEVSR